MSTLATKIADATTTPVPGRKGPPNVCHPVYGPGDLDDWEAIEGLRDHGLTWREVQEHVDQLLGVDKHLPLEKFKYHFRRRCFCWPVDLRR